MSLRSPLALVLAVAASLAVLPSPGRAQAAVEGRVELPRGSHAAPVVTRRYEIISQGGTVSTDPPLAVVYLEGPFPTKASAPPPVRQVTQRGLAFQPALLPVQVGTRVEFPNLDDTYHNIFSFSPAKRFDLGRYRPEERPVPGQTFDTPGLVTLRCEIHEHMRGLILVLDTPHFVLTEPDGRYRLNGLPAGRYTLKAWVNSQRTLEQPVELKGGATAQVDFP